MKLCPTTSNTPLAPFSEALRTGKMERSTCMPLPSYRGGGPPAVHHHEGDRKHHQSKSAEHRNAREGRKAEPVAHLGIERGAQCFHAIGQRIRSHDESDPT